MHRSPFARVHAPRGADLPCLPGLPLRCRYMVGNAMRVRRVNRPRPRSRTKRCRPKIHTNISNFPLGAKRLVSLSSSPVNSGPISFRTGQHWISGHGHPTPRATARGLRTGIWATLMRCVGRATRRIRLRCGHVSWSGEECSKSSRHALATCGRDARADQEAERSQFVRLNSLTRTHSHPFTRQTFGYVKNRELPGGLPLRGVCCFWKQRDTRCLALASPVLVIPTRHFACPLAPF
jgi:hypothetical protein